MAQSRFGELMKRPLPDNTEPILYGAIAVCKSWTFTTDRIPFCLVIEELKNEVVPEPFRQGIDAFVSYNAPNLPASDETDMIFRNLGWYGDGLGYIFDDRRGGIAPYCGLRFIWEDKQAEQYIVSMGFRETELDWLWSIAQRLHTFSGEMPERRHFERSESSESSAESGVRVRSDI